MQTNFNIFRINCWLDDIDGNNFNCSISSLIYDFLYSKSNKETLSREIYLTISEDLSINIDKDYFDDLISRNKNLEKHPTDNDVLIKLTSTKFKEIDENVVNNSLEIHIERFLRKKGYDENLTDKITQLLANSLYENILVFSTKNIKSILDSDCGNDFTQNEIDIFNEFIDSDNKEKNNAIYSTFLKAVEFAILTSGRGVKDISKDIFKNKTYYLDTNIIIRLLGVGGDERQKTIEKLLNSCFHEGIRFEVSFATERELNNKISERCDNLRRQSDLHSMEVLQKLSGDVGLNQDFATHYAQMRINGKAKSINKYELLLRANYQKIKSLYSFKGESLTSKLDSSKINKLAETLYSGKNDEFGVRYTKTAAKIDAINVLYVRHLRGDNNYNYNDIKSFYLTTDRTLNKVLSMQDEKNIPETILPSQLFLLHNSSIEKDDNDIKQFVKFIKKRTTEFKLYGSEALRFVEEIRDVTSNVDDLSSILKAYSDRKYECTHGEVNNYTKVTTFSEFAKSKIDQELWEARKGDDKYKSALDKAIRRLKFKYSSSVTISYSIEFVFYFVIGYITNIYLGLENLAKYIAVGLIALSIGSGFIFKDSFGVSRFIKRWIYNILVKKSNFSKVFGNDDYYLKKAEEVING